METISTTISRTLCKARNIPMKHPKKIEKPKEDWLWIST